MVTIVEFDGVNLAVYATETFDYASIGVPGDSSGRSVDPIVNAMPPLEAIRYLHSLDVKSIAYGDLQIVGSPSDISIELKNGVRYHGLSGSGQAVTGARTAHFGDAELQYLGVDVYDRIIYLGGCPGLAFINGRIYSYKNFGAVSFKEVRDSILNSAASSSLRTQFLRCSPVSAAKKDASLDCDILFGRADNVVRAHNSAILAMDAAKNLTTPTFEDAKPVFAQAVEATQLLGYTWGTNLKKAVRLYNLTETVTSGGLKYPRPSINGVLYDVCRPKFSIPYSEEDDLVAETKIRKLELVRLFRKRRDLIAKAESLRVDTELANENLASALALANYATAKVQKTWKHITRLMEGVITCHYNNYPIGSIGSYISVNSDIQVSFDLDRFKQDFEARSRSEAISTRSCFQDWISLKAFRSGASGTNVWTHVDELACVSDELCRVYAIPLTQQKSCLADEQVYSPLIGKDRVIVPRTYTQSRRASNIASLGITLVSVLQPLYDTIKTTLATQQELMDTIKRARRFYDEKMVARDALLAEAENYQRIIEAHSEFVRYIGIKAVHDSQGLEVPAYFAEKLEQQLDYTQLFQVSENPPPEVRADSEGIDSNPQQYTFNIASRKISVEENETGCSVTTNEQTIKTDEFEAVVEGEYVDGAFFAKVTDFKALVRPTSPIATNLGVDEGTSKMLRFFFGIDVQYCDSWSIVHSFSSAENVLQRHAVGDAAIALRILGETAWKE